MAGLLRTRVDRGCNGGPGPVEVVGQIAPAHTVVVHDPDDWYFGPEHAQAIYDAAGEPKDLWWEEEAGHGSDLLTPAFAERVLDLPFVRGAAPTA